MSEVVLLLFFFSIESSVKVEGGVEIHRRMVERLDIPCVSTEMLGIKMFRYLFCSATYSRTSLILCVRDYINQ